MATSQQQMRQGNRLLLVAIALALITLFVESAHAGGLYKKCPSGYKDWNFHKPGCEINIQTDPSNHGAVQRGNHAYNCSDCSNNCYKNLPYTKPKCYGGHCKYTYKQRWGDCDGKIHSNGCETNLSKDVYICGECGHQCPCNLKGGEPSCSHGKCDQQCKKGSKYDNQKKGCVPERK